MARSSSLNPIEASQGNPLSREQGLSPRGLGLLAAVILVIQFPLLHYLFLRAEPEVTATVPYQQDFSDPAVVARDFFSTGGQWRTVQGELLSPGVKNNPLWLKARLPPDVVIEFDARAESPQGDIKVELFGDGSDHASGYVLIHGGWNNSLSVIARRDEHSPNRIQSSALPVEPGRTYHWRIERKGSRLTWAIDGQPFLHLDDPAPLRGKGHDRFAFSSWDSQLFFDNLKIQAL